MGLLEGLMKRDKGAAEGEGEKKGAEQDGRAKYGNEPCSLCGAVGTEKKWMGQYWHRKCMRKMKKQAKGMV